MPTAKYRFVGTGWFNIGASIRTFVGIGELSAFATVFALDLGFNFTTKQSM